VPESELDRIIDAIVFAVSDLSGACGPLDAVSDLSGACGPLDAVSDLSGAWGPLDSGEDPDGSGHPRGLCGEAVPLFARIITVTVSFLLLTMGARVGLAGARAARSGWNSHSSPAEAYDRLRLEAGRRYDPGVLAALGRVLGR
jgi:hypothetical protein